MPRPSHEPLRSFRLFDGGRRELTVCACIALVLVLVRCFPGAWYEQLHFDSDQAIIGLMAKHLSEGRTFPLFFYGQHYMLGVQAWLAAPLFLVGGPTLMMVRLPLVFINCVAGVLLVAILVREAGLRPVAALASALPFLMPSPLISTWLLETGGASAEPFLYVLVLWLLRTRPVPFGLVLAVGSLHREFTIFALPALIAVMAGGGTLFTRSTAEKALTVIGTAAIVWMGVDLLKGHLGVFGPDAPRIEAGPLSLELQTIAGRICLAPGEIVQRVRSLLFECLPDLFGGRMSRLQDNGVNSTLQVGSALLGIWLLVGAVLVTGRLAVLLRRARSAGPPFLWYLALVGLQVIAVYPLACEIVPGLPPVVRYTLLGLFVPVAIMASYLLHEPVPMLRRLALAGLFVWVGATLAWNLRLIAEYRTHTPENKSQQLADDLVAHGVKYAIASYWDAYVLDFYSRERVVVASDGKVRIRDYQSQVDRHRAEAWRIIRQPCSTGRTFLAWCIESPP